MRFVTFTKLPLQRDGYSPLRLVTQADGTCTDTDSIRRGLIATAMSKMTYEANTTIPSLKFGQGVFRPQDVSNSFSQEVIATTRLTTFHRHLFHSYSLKIMANWEAI